MTDFHETVDKFSNPLADLIERMAGEKPSDSLLTSKFAGWEAKLLSTDTTRLVYRYPHWILDGNPLDKLGILNAINAGLFRSKWTEWVTCG